MYNRENGNILQSMILSEIARVLLSGKIRQIQKALNIFRHLMLGGRNAEERTPLLSQQYRARAVAADTFIKL